MHRFLAASVTLAAIVAGSASLAGQTASAVPPRAAAIDAWTPPLGPDGHPDLQGVWSNNGITPMTRPTQWKDKDKLTDQEVKELQGLIGQYVSQGGDAVFQNMVQLAVSYTHLTLPTNREV